MEVPLHVVVEGKYDAAVLRGLLPQEYSRARFFAAGGRSSVETVARNLLVHETGVVIIVADSDTHDPERVRDDRTAMQVALRNVAPGRAFDVFLFVPEIEVLFFEHPPVLDTLREGASRDLELLEHGRELPRRSLKTLLGQQRFETWIAGLSDAAWCDLRTGRQAQALLGKVSALVPEGSSTP